MNPFTDFFGNIIKAASACCCRPKVRPACAVGYSCTHSMETPPLVNKITHRNAITAEPGEHTLLSDNGWTRCSQLCHPPMARVGQYSWSEGGSQWIVLRPKDTSTLQKTESEMRLMADIFCISSALVCFLQTALQSEAAQRSPFHNHQLHLWVFILLFLFVSVQQNPAMTLCLQWASDLSDTHNTYTHKYTHTESRGRRKVCGRDEPPLVTRQPHTFLWL